jgi:surfeit locus 1 family protein
VRNRAPILWAGAFALAGFVGLIALGIWQLERKTWKENLIATLDRRLAASPVALPPPRDWPRLAPGEFEFRRVVTPLEFLGRPPAYVYSSGSALRSDIKAPGYFVFAPARLDNGDIVVVNEGYAPEPNLRPHSGKTKIVGYLRWPERPTWFVAEHDASACDGEAEELG